MRHVEEKAHGKLLFLNLDHFHVDRCQEIVPNDLSEFTLVWLDDRHRVQIGKRSCARMEARQEQLHASARLAIGQTNGVHSLRVPRQNIETALVKVAQREILRQVDMHSTVDQQILHASIERSKASQEIHRSKVIEYVQENFIGEIFERRREHLKRDRSPWHKEAKHCFPPVGRSRFYSSRLILSSSRHRSRRYLTMRSQSIP